MAESAVLLAAAGTAVSSGSLSSGEFHGGDVAESAGLFAAAGLLDLLGVRVAVGSPAVPHSQTLS